MRPALAYKKTTQRIETWRAILRDGLAIPPQVLRCSECNATLHVEFDDTWIDGDEFGAGTIRWYCSKYLFVHGREYSDQDEVMDDEEKIVRYIQHLYPTFKHEC